MVLFFLVCVFFFLYALGGEGSHGCKAWGKRFDLCEEFERDQMALPGGETTSFARKVAGWLVPDVCRYLFLLVWVCGVPIHVRYVVHLLRMSAASLEIVLSEMTGETTTQRVAAAATEPPVCPSEHALRAAAVDILFARVAAECQEANERVRGASLSENRWAEVRSLSYRTSEDGATRIVAQDATRTGEVLALVSAADESLAGMELIYFTAVDQARVFREQYATSCLRFDTQRGENDRVFANSEPKQQQRRRTSGARESETSVIILDSDDDGGGAQSQTQEVVILSDDGTDHGVPPAKRQRGSSDFLYELVE